MSGVQNSEVTKVVSVEFEDYIHLRLEIANLGVELKEQQRAKWEAKEERDNLKARVEELNKMVSELVAELDSYKLSEFREINLIDITKQNKEASND